MVFINNLYDVTLSPGAVLPTQALLSTITSTGGNSFQTAAAINNIYQGNGRICQQKICASITGDDSAFNNCQNSPDWPKIVAFCGPSGTPAMYQYGAYWNEIPADLPTKMYNSSLQQVKKDTGYNQFPDPYNVQGQYP
jgi:hypothetical protein